MREGRCACGALTYRVNRDWLIVHACHCTYCQRETGSAFAVNALVETSAVELTAGETDEVTLPSASGKGQRVVQCASCHAAVWSHYAGMGDAIAFVRVGTLDRDAPPPDVHIFVDAKQPWVALPEGARAFEAFYPPREVWVGDVSERIRAARAEA